MKKYVKTGIYNKICKIKYISFDWKLFGKNVSFVKINLSCHRENVYLHINPSPIHNFFFLLFNMVSVQLISREIAFEYKYITDINIKLLFKMWIKIIASSRKTELLTYTSNMVLN